MFDDAAIERAAKALDYLNAGDVWDERDEDERELFREDVRAVIAALKGGRKVNIKDFLLDRITADEDAAHKLALSDRRPLLSIASTVDHPERILAECAAKRKLVEEYGRYEMYYGPKLFYVLASVYADHPDYQQEWAL